MSCLYYVVGPSGVGKDSLISFARLWFEKAGRTLIYCHRYITCEPGRPGEDQIVLSEYEFSRREALGFFALTWRSHGNAYGLGSEIRTWLRARVPVIVNGSRGALPEADKVFGPALVPVLVEADPEVLLSRLEGRGRETGEALRSRVRRGADYGDIRHPRLRRIDNSGALETAGLRLVEVLAETQPERPVHQV